MSNADLKARQLATLQRRVNDRLRNSPYPHLMIQTKDFSILFALFMEEFQKLQQETAPAHAGEEKN